jgi:hopanoid C-2 methylase
VSQATDGSNRNARASTVPARPRRRVLVVNCYLDETREPLPRANKIPQAMGPAYLAGMFSRELCEIKLYSELFSGPLEDEQLLGWPDMLVLTGLTTALDRMLHVTAYARSKNPKVIVVAGGPAVRMLPQFCSQYFDYCCQGDVEELRDVIEEAWGAAYAAEKMFPRFDLVHWIGHIGHVESSRYCNFRCAFCTLTAEGRGYQMYDVEHVRRQIRAAGKRRILLFIDNNFYGNNRDFFLARMEMLRELHREGAFGGWAALVTSDFFLDERNLQLAKESGCVALFSGVESFDLSWLRSMNKFQNTRCSTVDTIRKTLDAGIVFTYGLVLDLTTRSVASVRQELEQIIHTPEITLPAYVSVTIPMLGTPFFRDCVAKGIILPGTRVRDLDGTTISLRPLDPLDEAAEFVRDLQTFRGYHGRILKQSFGFARRYARRFSWVQMILAQANPALLCAPVLATSPTQWMARRRRRTYVSSTDILGSMYQPAFRVESRFAHYFQPTRLTDSRGRITEELAEDLLGAHSSPRARAAAPLVSVAAL